MHTGSAQEKALKPQELFKPLYQNLSNYAGTLLTPSTSFRPLPAYSFTYSLPKGAIFCRMEDALHQRFNIWIKFRMGDDDRYSN
jgi:hypothetical protein